MFNYYIYIIDFIKILVKLIVTNKKIKRIL